MVYILIYYNSFNAVKNNFHYYKAKDCMKKFCEDLKEHAAKIIKYKKRNDTINI